MMNDDDLMNDAIDAQIQQAIGRSRASTLHGMAQAPGVPQQGLNDNDGDEGTLAMMAEDDDEDDKKQGGGLGGIVGSIMGG